MKLKDLLNTLLATVRRWRQGSCAGLCVMRTQRPKMLGLLVCGLLLSAGVGIYVLSSSGRGAADKGEMDGRRGGPRDGRPSAVAVADIRTGDLDVVLSALGTVTPLNFVNIRPRVDGQLVQIQFKEGQLVKAGEVLAEIDPRPFQIAVDQARGQLLRDQAQLANARLDLQRYQGLWDKDAISRQQLDSQQALVQQYEGLVKVDQAQVDNAQLQLDFTRIKAPVAGRLGLRQVDVGNMVKSSDTTGLVTLTQTQPISVIFSVAAERFPAVLERWLAAQKRQSTLSVEAWSQDQQTRLATGKLLTIDNQMDSTTGTVKLKAIFENADQSLFPNQFVNIRLRAETRKDVLLMPEAALQRGTQGEFVYVVKADEAAPASNEGKPPLRTVSMRNVKTGPAQGGLMIIEDGLQAGDVVVIDGLDKLREGAKVFVPERKGAR